MKLCKSVVVSLVVILLSFSSVFATNHCTEYLNSNGVTNDWRKAEYVMAFEWLAVASLARDLRFHRKAKSESFLNKLAALEQIKSVYLTHPQLIMSHPAYADVRLEALSFFGNVDLMSNVGSSNPMIVDFLGKDFMNSLENQWYVFQEEIKHFINDNIDAIIVNALGLPTVTRAQRLGYALRPLRKALGASLKISLAGVVAGLSVHGGGVIAADYFSDPALQETSTYYSSMAITSTIVGSKVMVGLVSLYTPIEYLRHSKTPAYKLGTYNHDVGRRVRSLYL